MSRNTNDQAGEMLIQEVEEDLRREQYIRIWRAYGKYMIAAMIGVVLLVAGYQGWKSWEHSVRSAEAARFSAAIVAVTDGKTDEALKMLGALSSESTTGYLVLSAMAEAELRRSNGDVEGAVQAYQRLINGVAPALYRDLARLKLAMLLLEQKEPAKASEQLGTLMLASNPWRISAMELQALAALQQADKPRAAELYRQIAADAAAPQGVRARAGEMLALGIAPQEPAADPAATGTSDAGASGR